MFALAAIVAMALALAAGNPGDNGPRAQFMACAKTSMDKAGAAKIAPEGFADFARQTCTSELTRFRSDVVAYAMKAGWTRKKAEPDADAQISEALADWTDRYRDKGSITAPK